MATLIKPRHIHSLVEGRHALRLNDTLASELFGNISASAIVNQAIIKFRLIEIELTHDNIIPSIGDYFDPAILEYKGLTIRVLKEIDDTLSLISLMQNARKSYLPDTTELPRKQAQPRDVQTAGPISHGSLQASE